MLAALKRFFSRMSEAPTELDWLPVTDVPEWREQKLKHAAKVYGRPFKCAADGLPREIIRNGTPTVTPSATVTKLERKRGKS